MMAKTDVNGESADPLFRKLRDVTMHGDPVTWNFAKFLCDGKGNPVRAYPPKVDPFNIVRDIAELIHPQ
jgi:glutathione peroxidase